jgi:hypothetical protein
MMQEIAMFKFYVPDIAEFSNTNESILKTFDYSRAPFEKLDFLVRESVQNSLDASRNKKVIINFDHRDFDPTVFQKYLEKFPTLSDLSQGKLLEIRDHGRGLDGPISQASSTEDYQDHERGYLSLVTKIGHNHAGYINSDAGGSFGHGKTILYHFGIGLIIFYSRISPTEERLGICLIPNEITNQLVNTDSDICFWGEIKLNIDQNKRHAAITDGQVISQFLNELNIKPFDKDQTGTSISVPWFDVNVDSDHIEAELYLSLCRFYTNRIYLRDSIYTINDEVVKLGKPCYGFDTNRDSIVDYLYWLYRYSNEFRSPLTDLDHLLFDNRYLNIKTEKIFVQFNSQIELGCLSYIEVEFDLDKMSTFLPTLYPKSEESLVDYPKVVVGFSRKLGMTVNYWTEHSLSLPKLNLRDGCIILGSFVLNDEVKLPDYKVFSEYKTVGQVFRHFETNKHTDWWYEGKKLKNEYRLAEKLKNKVKSIFLKAYTAPKEPKKKVKTVHAASDKIMNRLLSIGFGTRPTTHKRLKKKTKTPDEIRPIKQQKSSFNPLNFGYQKLHEAQEEFINRHQEINFDSTYLVSALCTLSDIEKVNISFDPLILGLGKLSEWQYDVSLFPIQPFAVDLYLEDHSLLCTSQYVSEFTTDANDRLSLKIRFKQSSTKFSGSLNCFFIVNDKYLIAEIGKYQCEL